MDSIEGVPEVLPQSLKNLGDKSFDRRKAAAQEITLVVSNLYVLIKMKCIICRKKEMKKKSRKCLQNCQHTILNHQWLIIEWELW